MDAADLRIFATVARLGGIGRAAAALNTVQSNVTARIRALEEDLGLPLFDRHSRGVTLTAAGRRLLPYAGHVSALLDEARRAAVDDGIPRGPLAVGSLETTTGLRLPPVLAAFTARWPDTDLSLATGTTDELVAAVLDRRLDGALVCGPVGHPALCEETVFREDLVIAAAPGFADLAALFAAPRQKVVVFRSGCSYRHRLEAVLAAHGRPPVPPLELGTLDGIVGCVAAGVGFTLLPHSVLAPLAAAGRVALHPLPPEQARADTVFVRRADRHLSSALAAFLACAHALADGGPSHLDK